MSEIKGYKAGSGATFTPSKKASWIEGFNDLLVTTGMSRNALTDHLIEVGLAHNNTQEKSLDKIETDTLFNNAYFSPRERELLNTSTYQQIIREFAKSLISNSRIAMETTFQQALTPNYTGMYSSSPTRLEQLPVQQPIEISSVTNSDISVPLSIKEEQDVREEKSKQKNEASQPVTNDFKEKSKYVVQR